MFELFKKLMMAGQIKFEEGNISFLNSRVLITPSELLINLMNRFKYNDNICLEFYRASKSTNIKGFAKEVSRKYNLKQLELAKWLINTGNVSGWGNIKFIAQDNKNKTGVVEVRNGISQKIKSKIPVDHFLRGQIAGGTSAAFNMEFECIERKCIAEGDECCEFVIKPRSIFIKEGISKKFATQIFTNDEIKKLKIPILK